MIQEENANSMLDVELLESTVGEKVFQLQLQFHWLDGFLLLRRFLTKTLLLCLLEWIQVGRNEEKEVPWYAWRAFNY